jgi:hypothetical protein
MELVLGGLSLLIGLGSLVCFILVVIQMFKHNETTIGILSIVLAFCGIGFLLAFIYGWIKASEWNIKNLMLAWTALVILSILIQVVAIATGASAMPQQIPQ